MTERGTWSCVTTADQLESIIGLPVERVRDKVRPALHPLDVAWLAASPFCVVGTADADGRCDVSPKGDPAGCVARALDDRTVVVAERPGNRRVDGFRNVLANPHVGLLFLIPGRGDTLRINGPATLVSDADFFDDLVVAGHRPALAMVLDVEEVFHHCSKAFLRSRLWDPASWQPDAVASRAVVAHTLERADEPFEQVAAYYADGSYGANLYG